MRILIAEDNELARVLLRNVLAGRTGFEITEAPTGRAAWEILNKGLHPDLCIFDIMMPELNGVDLLKRIRSDERFKGLRVVMCSVMSDKQTITQVAGLQVKHYILKPFKVEFVIQTIEQALGNTPRHPLEAANVICDRLSISPDKLAPMLDSLVEGLTKTIAEMRTLLERANLAKALSIVSVQKEAALNLGALRVAAVMQQLEDTFARAIQSPASSVFVEQIAYLNGLLDQVDSENHRLKESMAAATAQLAIAI